MNAIGAVILAALLATGCMVPISGATGVDPAVAAQLAKEVPLYDPSQVNANNSIKVGSLVASDCDNGIFGGPGRDGMIAALRQKAKSIGANGITDLSCSHTPTDDRSMLGGCYASMACSATALRVVPLDSSTN
jgi:hypothetical protein